MEAPSERILEYVWIDDPKVSSLIKRYARSLAKCPGFSRSDEQDIEQEFRIHLVKKAARFESSRSHHRTFAARIIKNKATSMRRALLRQKRDATHQVSIDEAFRNGHGNAIAIAQSIEGSEGRRHTGRRMRTETELSQLKLDVAEANKVLPQPLRDMAALLSHVPVFAAAQVMGISRRQAAAHLATLRACYEARGLTP